MNPGITTRLQYYAILQIIAKQNDATDLFTALIFSCTLPTDRFVLYTVLP